MSSNPFILNAVRALALLHEDSGSAEGKRFPGTRRQTLHNPSAFNIRSDNLTRNFPHKIHTALDAQKYLDTSCKKLASPRPLGIIPQVAPSLEATHTATAAKQIRFTPTTEQGLALTGQLHNQGGNDGNF